MIKHSKTYFIAGIGTDVGKTVVSAVVAEALSAAYWKPVQSGDLDWTDSMKVRSFCSEKVEVLPERFRLETAASPHLSARLENTTILETDFTIPETGKNLIIEGAGGLMVPLNDDGLLYIDLIKSWKLPVILVARHYLGSINHTLLSLEMLKQSGVEVHALIFSGDSHEPSESAILTKFPVEKVIHIPQAEQVTAAFVQEQAALVKDLL